MILLNLDSFWYIFYSENKTVLHLRLKYVWNTLIFFYKQPPYKQLALQASRR